MAAVGRRWPIVFDLAAHSRNRQHARYFSRTRSDRRAAGHDALSQRWAPLTRRYGGHLWLNPPFRDIDPWASKCKEEGRDGADILLLVPVATGAPWYARHIFGVADRYFLQGRLAFKKGEAHMRDCVLARFWPGMSGQEHIWAWRRDALLRDPRCEVGAARPAGSSYRVLARYSLPGDAATAGESRRANESGFVDISEASRYISDLGLVHEASVIEVSVAEKIVMSLESDRPFDLARVAL
jgi:hypothetical protein